MCGGWSGVCVRGRSARPGGAGLGVVEVGTSGSPFAAGVFLLRLGCLVLRLGLVPPLLRQV